MAGPNNPNSPNSGGLKDMWEKLARGERVELHTYEALPPAVNATKLKDAFNITVWKRGRILRVRSGGYELKIDMNKVVVYDKNGEKHHEIVGVCLVRNLTTLLFRVVGRVPEERWVSYSLNKNFPEVRRLQAWVLAVITNFSKPLKHNPMICDPKMLGDSPT
jgi:hypothetical protein